MGIDLLYKYYSKLEQLNKLEVVKSKRMKLNKNHTITFQVTEIIKLLEKECGAYNLMFDDIPIWWFIRNELYRSLSDSLLEKRGYKKIFKYENNKQENSINIILSKFKIYIIFIIRSFISLFYIQFCRDCKIDMIFLTNPVAFRKYENRKQDIYFSKIAKFLKSNNYLFIERTSQKNCKYNSALPRKKVIFFDGLMLLSIIKNCVKIIKLKYKNKHFLIKGWDNFSENCYQINFKVFSADFLLQTIRKIIFSLIPKIIIQVGASKVLLKKFSPNIILETGSNESSVIALNYIAKKQNTKIFELQHGYITNANIAYSYFLPKNYKDIKPLPDKIFVYGDAFKDMITNVPDNIISKNNIKVIGYQRMENYFKNKISKTDSIYRRVRKILKIKKNANVVLVTSQWNTNIWLSEFLYKVLSLIDKTTYILLKLHPVEVKQNEWREIYKKLLFNSNFRIIKDEDVDLYDALLASNIHATTHSTVFFECLSLGIPNIIIKHPWFEYGMKISEYIPVSTKNMIIIDSSQEFVTEVNKIFQDENYKKKIINYQKAISSYFYANDKDSKKNIIEEIDKVLKYRS